MNPQPDAARSDAVDASSNPAVVHAATDVGGDVGLYARGVRRRRTRVPTPANPASKRGSDAGTGTGWTCRNSWPEFRGFGVYTVTLDPVYPAPTAAKARLSTFGTCPSGPFRFPLN